MKCNLCPNRCNVNRDKQEGLCHSTNDMRICRIAPHYYEEPVISGEKGSGTVFFSGCSLDCEFCQNHEISKNKVGKVFSCEDLADELRKLTDQGVHNINFVTPTHFSHKIIETLKIFRPPIPIVYNTSGYELSEVIDTLSEYVDVFLTDFKYANNEIAKKYSKRKGYFDFCLNATQKMVENKPLLFENGLLKQGVIIRHLMLPTEVQNTLDVIDLFAERWKKDALFSLMAQFFPTYQSTIKRSLKPIEYKIALNRLQERGVENGYVQDLTSAQEEYVPIFDLI